MVTRHDVEEAVEAARELNLPLTMCPNCGGHGRHARRDFVWTREDREADPEGFEEYMAGGMDVDCEACFGLRVLPVDFAARVGQEPRVRGFVDQYGNVVAMPGADY